MKANVIYSYNRRSNTLIEEWRSPSVIEAYTLGKDTTDPMVVVNNHRTRVLLVTYSDLYYNNALKVFILRIAAGSGKPNKANLLIRYTAIPESIHKVLAECGVSLAAKITKGIVPFSFKFKNELEYIII